MATNRSSTLYTSRDVNHYVTDGRDKGGEIYPIRLSYTTISGEVSGDSVNLAVLPANARVIGLTFVGNGLFASAGANGTVKLTSGTTDITAATDLDLTGASLALAAAGINYTPTADEIVKMTYGTANPVKAKTVEGVLLVVSA